MSSNTYTTEELWDMISDNLNNFHGLTKVYIPDCKMFQYFVREVWVSGIGNRSIDEIPRFVLSDQHDNDFSCEKYADEIYKTYEAAKEVADKQQEKILSRFGGKDELDKARLQIYDMMHDAHIGQLL